MGEIENVLTIIILKDNNSLNSETESYFTFSDDETDICKWFLFTVVCQLIAMFGIVTNIINIICFVKQGFKDPVNVSLFGLALADLGCLITLVWIDICTTPAFTTLDLSFDPFEVQYLTGGMPRIIFTRLSGWITAVITLERCLCITVPLKVKNVVTSKRVAILIGIISVALLSSASPLYMVNRLGMKYFPSRNKTLLGLIFAEDRGNVETISFAINNVLIPFGAFSVIIVCTIKLVTKLHTLTKWRKQATATEQNDNVSTRNQKVAKMVVMISSLFIACFIPISIIFAAIVIEPEFSVDGKYRNMLIVFAGVAFVLEAINSSVNIFIYYHMSSKYRNIINSMCCFRSTKTFLRSKS